MNFKHPSRVLIAVLALIIIGVVVGIVVLIGTSHHALTPEGKLQQDGYSQSPGITDNTDSDIGINSAGAAEFVSPGCETLPEWKTGIINLGFTGQITASCSDGFLVLYSPLGPSTLISFSEQLAQGDNS